MADVRLFIDFGSTYTKVVAVDLDRGELLSRVQVPSTVDSDITIGMESALEMISADVRIGDREIAQAVACSSAAGGLRMVCVGFVPELTSEAAIRAALGAGAKVVGTYSYELTASEIDEIDKISPDIVLLCGGTDGGNKKVIIHNARMLASSIHNVANFILAGNKVAYDEIRAIFADSAKNVLFTKNVMPGIGTLEVGPCNEAIRDLFISRITEAKGIARAKSIIRDVIMPTPSAVLEAARVMADGCADDGGLGELVVVDVGGATTDVHSVAKGNPTEGVAAVVGLPEPYVKRTVEGDLGMVCNIETLATIASGRMMPHDFDEIVKAIRRVGHTPQGDEQIECHTMLSNLAVEVAVDRHVGRLEVLYGPSGEMLVQRGKDLTQVRCLIGTGGPVAFSTHPRRVLDGALYKEHHPHVLKPRTPELYLDKEYILFAVGLLAVSDPKQALNLARRYLKRL